MIDWKRSGRSFCAAVSCTRFTIPRLWATVHCTRCQRWTASSLAGVVVAKEHFRLTKGEDLVKRYESELAPRNFCRTCGSSLDDDLGEK